MINETKFLVSLLFEFFLIVWKYTLHEQDSEHKVSVEINLQWRRTAQLPTLQLSFQRHSPKFISQQKQIIFHSDHVFAAF